MNLVRVHVPTNIVEELAPLLHVLVPAKYQRRWARRLQENFDFSREDAHLLSLATFGTDMAGSILGGDLFVTLDLKCIDRFVANSSLIERRFSRMVSHLPPPYAAADLPEAVTPTEALRLPADMVEE
jgi:hypothetical protein